MPRRQIAHGLSPSMGRPRKRTLPASAGSWPVRMLKSVVFPAPFGPISARISPAGSTKRTSSTACTPPNDFRTPVTSSTSVTGSLQHAEDAARKREHQRDEDHAEHHLPVLGVLRRDRVEDLVDGGADRRAGERLDPAEEHERRAGEAAEEAGDDEREPLVTAHVHTDRLGATRVIAGGAEHESEGRL